MGNGLAAAFTHGHAVARARVAIDRAIDAAMRAVGCPPDKREIAALERRAATAVIGELCSKRRMRAIVLRHHHEAGRILVEPVNDARPALAADAGEAVAAMGDQGIDQRTGPVAGGRMNDETRGLFDDDDVVVLVNHGERDRLRAWPCRTRRRHVNLDGSSGIDPMTGIADRMPVDLDRAGLDQGFQPRARQVGEVAGQQPIEPFAGLIGGHQDGSLRGRGGYHE